MKSLLTTLFCLMLIGGQGFTLSTSAYVPTLTSSSNSEMAKALVPVASKAGLTINGDYMDVAPSHLNIEQGNLLLNPDTDVVVSTPKAELSVKSGATLFLMASDKALVIYDLYQTKAEQVSVQVGKANLEMVPGQMLVVSSENATDFEALQANCHSIGYRKAKQIDLHNQTIQGYTAEFSLLSALNKIQPLNQLAASGEMKDRIIPDRVLKCAIALAQITAQPIANGGMGR